MPRAKLPGGLMRGGPCLLRHVGQRSMVPPILTPSFSHNPTRPFCLVGGCPRLTSIHISPT